MRERKGDEDDELEGDKTKLIFVCAEAGIKYIQEGRKTVRINDARAGETQGKRARGNDRNGVVVRRRPEDDRAFEVVGVDVLGARARRAQSF